jgi:hypothetical protein
VDDLIQAIEEYLASHNEQLKPFVWTATVPGPRSPGKDRYPSRAETRFRSSSISGRFK